MEFTWPPVLHSFWRVPRVISNDKGFALYMCKVKLTLKKNCSLHSGFFSRYQHFYHPFPLHLQALHKLSAIVAIIIFILQMEVLRTRWLSFAKALRWVPAATVKVFVPHHPPFTLLCVLVLRPGFLILGSVMHYFTPQFFGFRGLFGGGVLFFF